MRVLVVMFGVAILACGVAQAQGPETSGEKDSLSSDSTIYSARYGVSVEEAARRIAIMADQDALLSQLGIAEEDVSGIWFELFRFKYAQWAHLVDQRS